MYCKLNTLRPRQDGRHFPDDIFKCIFLNDNVQISLKISLKFVPKGPINNIPSLVQIMAWRRAGDKPLSEPMMVSLLTHICVTRPQWDWTTSSGSLSCYLQVVFACVIFMINRHMTWQQIRFWNANSRLLFQYKNPSYQYSDPHYNQKESSLRLWK